MLRSFIDPPSSFNPFLVMELFFKILVLSKSIRSSSSFKVVIVTLDSFLILPFRCCSKFCSSSANSLSSRL